MDKQNIDDIYPLTTLQQCFLLRSLSTTPDECLTHMRCRLDGVLNVEKLMQAWSSVVERHPVLRSTLHWNNVKRPVQIVHRKSIVRITQLDWRLIDDVENKLSGYLTGDLDNRIDLNINPTFRLTLIRTSDNSHEMIWTCHHGLLDGWSGAIVLTETFEIYDALVMNREPVLNASPPFKHYVRWLQNQDNDSAETFWRNKLSGFSKGTALPRYRESKDVPDEPDSSSPTSSHELVLSEAESSALIQYLSQSHLTLNSLVQGAWAILLCHYSNEQDVLFGATISGREGEFKNIENVVGLLINVIPVRVQMTANQSTLAWLQHLQSSNFSSLPHSHIDTTQILACSEVSSTLFDSLLVVENQPSSTPIDSLHVSNVQSGLVSNYGLTLIIKPGKLIAIELRCASRLGGVRLADKLLQEYRSILNQLIAYPKRQLVALELPDSSEISGRDNIVKNATPTTITNTLSMPDSSIEARLSEIWKEVLDVNHIDHDASFFDIGGNSLLAVKLFSRIEHNFQKKLPITTLFAANSINKMVDYLRSEDARDSWSTIVEIQTSGNKPPLFIPDVSTDLLIYRELSACLGHTQPIYAFRTKGCTEYTAGQLAHRLAKNMIEIQPVGPYQLMALSGGGALTLRIAEQIESMGRKVAFVAMIDCLGPNYPKLLPPLRRLTSVVHYSAVEFRRFVTRRHKVENIKKARTEAPYNKYTSSVTQEQASSVFDSTQGATTQGATTQRATTQRATTQRATSQGATNTYRSRFRSGRRMISSVIQHGSLAERVVNIISVLLLKAPIYTVPIAIGTYLQGLHLANTTSDDSQQHSASNAQLSLINDQYDRTYGDLNCYHGKLIFFLAKRKPPGIVLDPYMGWKEIVSGEMIIHEVPGDHITMVQQPNVHVLAKLLEQELERVTPAGRTNS